MQTFLPYPSFIESAKCLDNKRLGKQRVEAWQIYQTLQKIENQPFYGYDWTKKKIPWENHPIVRMWEGYEHALLTYGLIICNEWRQRGFKDTMQTKFGDEIEKKYFDAALDPSMYIYPPWLGNEAFHKSHRAKLYWKDKSHYDTFHKDYLELTNDILCIDEPHYLWYKNGEWVKGK